MSDFQKLIPDGRLFFSRVQLVLRLLVPETACGRFKYDNHQLLVSEETFIQTKAVEEKKGGNVRAVFYEQF